MCANILNDSLTCASDDIYNFCTSLGPNQCRDPITSICKTNPLSSCVDTNNYNNCLDVSSRAEYCISPFNIECEILITG
jgi:hypothetical protein